MFRIVCDPSSGSTELCLNEVTLSGSQIFFACFVGVWQRNFEPAMCVHGTTDTSYRAHTCFTHYYYYYYYHHHHHHVYYYSRWCARWRSG